MEPSPLPTFQVLEPESEVTQSIIDDQVPSWSNAHTAWLIEWEGSLPTRLILERYRREDCLYKASYLYSGDGELRKTTLILRSQESVQEEAEGLSLLVELLNALEEDSSAVFHEKDAAGRLSLTYKKETPVEANAPPIELIGRIEYEERPCILPKVIMMRNVPFKQVPAGR